MIDYNSLTNFVDNRVARCIRLASFQSLPLVLKNIEPTSSNESIVDWKCNTFWYIIAKCLAI